ncbi:hypothetical protein GLYMA_12G200450v4 [Glycine max]|nr:hypothetical protein GLYMA_12G200450v4 [Glycine max]KAH1144081.1 hypothetical protein GYH30_034341 [Glycine max]
MKLGGLNRWRTCMMRLSGSGTPTTSFWSAPTLAMALASSLWPPTPSVSSPPPPPSTTSFVSSMSIPTPPLWEQMMILLIGLMASDCGNSPTKNMIPCGLKVGSQGV